MAAIPKVQSATDAAPEQSKPLVVVRDLEVEYRTKRGTVKAVDEVSFDIFPHEVFGLAGESGCGKSTIAHAVTRILRPPAYITGGSITFKGEDVLGMDADTLRHFRWKHMSIVFQSAMNSLNPVLTVGTQIIDSLQAHIPITKDEARQRAEDLLRTVGIDVRRIDSYPHQLSGGMRQRAVIAIALALRPELIIMDEPTTALDVVVQKQILKEIRDLKEQFGFSILFITHDLSLLVEFTDRIGIMYAGELAEVGPSKRLFRNPVHPYTVRLMNSFPTISGERQQLLGIPGSPPDLVTPPPGCRFHPRCDLMIRDVCDVSKPVLQEVEARHFGACHLIDQKKHGHEK